MAQAKKIPSLPHRNRFVVPMNKRNRSTKMRHRADRRSKDARRSWRREEW